MRGPSTLALGLFFLLMVISPFLGRLLRDGSALFAAAEWGGSLLYVSRGTGTWGPPLRFLAPPEVTLFELVPAEHPTGAGDQE